MGLFFRLSGRGPPRSLPESITSVPVAQLDRALASGAKGCWFDPSQAHHLETPVNIGENAVFPLIFGLLTISGLPPQKRVFWQTCAHELSTIVNTPLFGSLSYPLFKEGALLGTRLRKEVVGGIATLKKFSDRWH